MSLARASCSFLCDEEGTGLVVDRLEVVPFTKLILPLDLSAGGHRQINTWRGLLYKAGGQDMASHSGRSCVEIIREAVRARNRRLILDAVTPFYVFRTDTQQVLARGVMGYDAAREKANQIRRQQGLKWDQVSFKSEKKPSGSYGRHPASSMGGAPSGARVDVSRRYNPSKRGRFRGYYDKDGNYHDID